MMKNTSNNTLGRLLDAALEKALASLEDRLASMVLEAAAPLLEKKIKDKVLALFGEEAPAEEAPAPAHPKSPAAPPPKATAAEAPPPAEGAQRPRTRRTKAPEAPALTEDPASITEAASVALGKYKGAFTPRGKPLEEVLARRLRSLIRYAAGLGRQDLRALAKAALVAIDSNPRGYATASWLKLAEDLGLPVPTKQGAEE
jgi:pyruvate/2-oxoglutarate dehydrogenase complex dihydrolipoamide acyltransferase (E2) component